MPAWVCVVVSLFAVRFVYALVALLATMSGKLKQYSLSSILDVVKVSASVELLKLQLSGACAKNWRVRFWLSSVLSAAFYTQRRSYSPAENSFRLLGHYPAWKSGEV